MGNIMPGYVVQFTCDVWPDVQAGDGGVVAEYDNSRQEGRVCVVGLGLRHVTGPCFRVTGAASYLRPVKARQPERVR